MFSVPLTPKPVLVLMHHHDFGKQVFGCVERKAEGSLPVQMISQIPSYDSEAAGPGEPCDLDTSVYKNTISSIVNGREEKIARFSKVKLYTTLRVCIILATFAEGSQLVNLSRTLVD